MDLGEGFFGKVLLALFTLVAGGVAGWFGRRPLEKAGVLEAVNKRMEAYMAHLEAELKRMTDQHAKCEERLDSLEESRRRDRDEIEQLRGQVAQEKQIAGSLARVKGEQA